MPTIVYGRRVVCPVTGRESFILADDAEAEAAAAGAEAAAAALGADGDGSGTGAAVNRDQSTSVRPAASAKRRAGDGSGHGEEEEEDDDGGAAARIRARPNGSSPVRRSTAAAAGGAACASSSATCSARAGHAGTSVGGADSAVDAGTENIPPSHFPPGGRGSDDDVIGAFDEEEEEEDVEKGENGGGGEGGENGDESDAAAGGDDDEEEEEEEQDDGNGLDAESEAGATDAVAADSGSRDRHDDDALGASVSLRPFVLLLNSNQKHELLQYEFDSDAVVSDLLDQTPNDSTDEDLREQTYTAVANQTGTLWSTALTDKLARFCHQANEVILPIPEDLSVAECSRVADDIISRPEINALLKSLTLIFNHQNGSSRRHMTVARDAKFGKIIRDYADAEGVARGTILLYFDGKRVKDDDTPVSLKLDQENEGERIIDVMVEQDGG